MERRIQSTLLAVAVVFACVTAAQAQSMAGFQIGSTLLNPEKLFSFSSPNDLTHGNFPQGGRRVQPASYYNDSGNGNCGNVGGGCSDGSCGGGYCDGGYCDSGCCDGGCYEPGCCCEPSCCCDAGGYCDCGGCYDCGDPCCGSYCGEYCGSCGTGGGWYGQAELIFMRAHVSEEAFGKLAEEYEPSYRFILGYEDCHGLGGRARYWHYGDHLRNINFTGGYRFEWDVYDLEMTKRFQFSRTDIVLAGGARYADASITGASILGDVDLLGLTMAADINTLLCCRCSSYVSAIYGGRLSILGGDWNNRGEPASHDDAVVVHELYGGVEYGCSHCGYDLYCQLKVEMQNWRSDYLGGDPNGIGDNQFNGFSVSFVGPSITIGAGF